MLFRSPTAPPAAEPSVKPLSQASAPSPSTRITPPNPHPRSRSFADCDAASSPITTPQASPLPPTPPLHELVADAINAAAACPPPLPLPRRAPARLPHSPASRGHSPFARASTPALRGHTPLGSQPSLAPHGSQPPMTPLPLPRRGARASLSQSHRGGAPPFGRPQARTGAANISTDSAVSARDVETQLTAGIPSATPSPQAPVSRTGEPAATDQERPEDMQMDAEAVGSRVPSLSYPANPYPPLRTQATYDSQGTVDTLP